LHRIAYQVGTFKAGPAATAGGGNLVTKARHDGYLAQVPQEFRCVGGAAADAKAARGEKVTGYLLGGMT
jgi:hypothetical protein